MLNGKSLFQQSAKANCQTNFERIGELEDFVLKNLNILNTNVNKLQDQVRESHNMLSQQLTETAQCILKGLKNGES
ncbi:hypothetical protein [Caudoviricetes sp.]|nr:hypothetical protein [Caudoviricetes sp.]